MKRFVDALKIIIMVPTTIAALSCVLFFVLLIGGGMYWGYSAEQAIRKCRENPLITSPEQAIDTAVRLAIPNFKGLFEAQSITNTRELLEAHPQCCQAYRENTYPNFDGQVFWGVTLKVPCSGAEAEIYVGLNACSRTVEETDMRPRSWSGTCSLCPNHSNDFRAAIGESKIRTAAA